MSWEREAVGEQFEVTLTLQVRPCTREDLPQLEWFGLFAPHRLLIAEVFHQQEEGDSLILVVDSGGTAVGQVWVDLVKKREVSVGVLWALRVMPGFQGAGLGSRLIRAAERALAERGFQTAELGVEKDNVRARTLYERMGYRLVGEEREPYRIPLPAGGVLQGTTEQIVLHRALEAPAQPHA